MNTLMFLFGSLEDQIFFFAPIIETYPLAMLAVCVTMFVPVLPVKSLYAYIFRQKDVFHGQIMLMAEGRTHYVKSLDAILQLYYMVVALVGIALMFWILAVQVGVTLLTIIRILSYGI